MRKLCPHSNFINELLDLRGEFVALHVVLPPAPTPVVQVAPAINKCKNLHEAFMGESVIHAGYRNGSVSIETGLGRS
jgi:hypothetical protein